eukprot:5250521-Amphidinium_carterae.1
MKNRPRTRNTRKHCYDKKQIVNGVSLLDSRGMAPLNTVTYFDISANLLAGMLPEEGLLAFEAMEFWAIALNSFSGVLPVVDAE